jgi:exodeoxyribonuclease VII small subunit
MNEKLTFEQSLDRLDRIVKNLERGDAPLAESLGLFEEGARLVRSCSAMLDEAEQKVVQLRKGEDGKPEELPFE